MPSKLFAIAVAGMLAVAACAPSSARWTPASTPAQPLLAWGASLATALGEAAKDGKPILLHVRRPFDLASVVTYEWLTSSPELVPVLNGFHRVAVASEHASLKHVALPDAAAVLLRGDGSLLAVIRDAPTRSSFIARVQRAVADPRTPEALKAAALAAPADAAVVRDTVDVLLSVGGVPDALAVLEAAIQAAPDPAVATALRLRLDFARAVLPTWASARLQRGQGVFRRFAEGKGEAPAVRLAAGECAIAVRLVLIGAQQDAVLQALAVIDRCAAAAQAPETCAPALKVFEESLAAAGLGERALAALRTFIDATSGDPADRIEAQQIYVRQIIYRSGMEREAAAFVKSLVSRVAAGTESLELLPSLIEAVIQLDLEAEHQLLAERAGSGALSGYRAAAANLDLADRAVEQGDLVRAGRHWDATEHAAAGESAAVVRAARGARSLLDGSASPERSRWAGRTALDAVVLVPDVGAYLAAISRWTPDTFFPVLFQDDLYAARFIAAYKPSAVYVAPATGVTSVDLDAARQAVLASWDGAPGSDLSSALQALGGKPPGTVFVRMPDGEALGGIALAAGRFQGLEELACEQDSRPVMTPDAVADIERQIRTGLARYGLPDADGRLPAITLAAAIPYRTTAAEFPAWGKAAAVDDCLGRCDDSTRYAVVSRLLGDGPRAVYQAMASLFLQPERALCFNTYGTDPKTIWGSYRTSVATEQFATRMPSEDVHGIAADIAGFRSRTRPWNPYGLMFINSSGGSTAWSVGKGGWTDDFPVGVPAAIHVTHSGSAGDPYNPDTLAGRALWGGSFWYFGSTAEPFLTAFQPPRYYAPRLVRGAPFTATFRLRTDDRFWSPWRLMMIGDPLFCLRGQPARRAAYVPVSGETRLAVPTGRDLAALRSALLLGERTLARQIIGQPDCGWVLQDGAALGLALEVLVREGAYAEAVERFRGASEAARMDYAARVHARTAATALLEAATMAKDLAAWQRRFADVLATGAPSEFALRYLKEAIVACRASTPEALPEFLEALTAMPETAPIRHVLTAEMVRVRQAVVLAKRPWSAEDAAIALAGLQEIVRSRVYDNDLKVDIAAFRAAWMEQAGVDAQGFAAALKGLQVDDAGQRRTIEAYLSESDRDRYYRQDWLFLGPFADPAAGAWEKVGGAAGRADLTASFSDGDRTLSWKPQFGPAGRGMVDLLGFMKPDRNVYAYAAADIEVPVDVDAILWLGSDDGVTVWLEGKEVHRNDIARAAVRDQDRVPLRLTAGTHRVVMRIDQIVGGWGFFFRVSGADGKAEPPGFVFRRPATP
jgi:hypothetical protein